MERSKIELELDGKKVYLYRDEWIKFQKFQAKLEGRDYIEDPLKNTIDICKDIINKKATQ